LKSRLRITLAQIEITQNLEKNLKKILEVVKASHSQLILFPELALTGYQRFSPRDASAIHWAFKEIQDNLQDKLLLLGAPYFFEEHIYNAYYLLSSKETFLLAKKELLFPGLDDLSGFVRGERRKLMNFDHTTWGILICFELRSPEMARALIKEGADGLIVPAQWPLSRIEHFKTLLKARAIENQCFVIGINGVGKVNQVPLGGNSAIFDPFGVEILSLGEQEEVKEIALELKQEFLPYPLRTPLPKTSKLKSLEELLSISEKRRKKGQIMVFTNGCFDILHAGHVDYLTKARRLGDFLVVGLNSDLSVSKIKGPFRPINTQDLRIEVLSALECVDYIVLFDEETPEDLIKALKPDILVKGADWPEEKIVGADYVKSYGGKVIRIEFIFDISTTKIIEKIKKF